MKEIFVLAEHRMGELRDVTLEMLTKGRQLAKSWPISTPMPTSGYWPLCSGTELRT